MYLAIGALGAMMGCVSRPEPTLTAEDLLELGRLEEAKATGLKIPAAEEKVPRAMGHWK